MSNEAQDLIARLWVRFAPLALARVRTVADYVHHRSTEGSGRDSDRPESASTAAGAGPTHAQARQAVHDLVGSLGSYGRPLGSEIAVALEALLGDGTTQMSGADLLEAGRLVGELEREVRE